MVAVVVVVVTVVIVIVVIIVAVIVAVAVAVVVVVVVQLAAGDRELGLEGRAEFGDRLQVVFTVLVEVLTVDDDVQVVPAGLPG